VARKSGAAGIVLLTLCSGQFRMMLDTFISDVSTTSPNIARRQQERQPLISRFLW
jgi:hypothetical protein